MLLGWPFVDLVGITTTAVATVLWETYVTHVVALAGRPNIRIEVRAGLSLTTLRVADPIVDDECHWYGTVGPHPSSPGGALDLFNRGIEAMAPVVATGPLTDLALPEVPCRGGLG